MDLKLFSLEAGVVSGLFLFVQMVLKIYRVGEVRLRQGFGAIDTGAASLPEKLVTRAVLLLSFPASALTNL